VSSAIGARIGPGVWGGGVVPFATGWVMGRRLCLLLMTQPEITQITGCASSSENF